MLNEPNADELNVDVANSGSDRSVGSVAAPTGAAAAAAAAAGDRPSDATLYLTQQDRDAIERVRLSTSIELCPSIEHNEIIHTLFLFIISSKA